MTEWSIGVVAKHFGVSPSTLRYYERRGFLNPHRTSTSDRRYDRSQVRRIAFLQLGSELGISLELIASLLDQPRPRWQEALEAERTRVEQHLEAAHHAAALLAATANCRHRHPGRDCPALRDALDLVVGGAHSQDLARRFAEPSGRGVTGHNEAERNH